MNSPRPESPLLASPSTRGSLIPYSKLQRSQSTYSAFFQVGAEEEEARDHVFARIETRGGGRAGDLPRPLCRR